MENFRIRLYGSGTYRLKTKEKPVESQTFPLFSGNAKSLLMKKSSLRSQKINKKSFVVCLTYSWWRRRESNPRHSFLRFLAMSSFLRFYAGFLCVTSVDFQLFQAVFSNHKGQIKDKIMTYSYKNIFKSIIPK